MRPQQRRRVAAIQLHLCPVAAVSTPAALEPAHGSIRIIDIGEDGGAESAAAALAAAFETTGFACVVGAGEALLSARAGLSRAGREFFALADAEKWKVHIGFGRIVVSEIEVPNMKENLVWSG
jgi:hypothetical protein